VNLLRRPGAALALVTAAALAVRIAGALLRPAWHDEYFTAWVASLPLGGILDALRVDSGPPLPYLLAKLVADLGPAPLAAARMVSLVAGTLAVLLAGRAAGRALGAEAGTWCAALLAFHPLALAWSCEGRGYALLLLAAALAWERLEALRENGRGAAGLAFALALGCWSHALGLVLAGVVAAVAFTLPRRERERALGATAAGLVVHSPWLPVALAQPAQATAWIGAAWAAATPLQRVLAPVRLVPTAAAFGGALDLPSAPLAAQLAAAALCLVLLAASRPRFRMAALVVLPAAGLWGLAWAGVPYLFSGRSEAVYLAPLLGMLAGGASRSRAARTCGALLVAAAAGTTAVALDAWWHAPPSAEARVAGAIARHLPGGGTVVVSGYWRLGVRYHLGDTAPRYALVNFPAEAAAHPGWYDDAADRAGQQEESALAAQLARERAAGAPVAIVVTPGLATAPPLTSLARGIGLQPALTVPGAVLWTTPAER
jgi:hypothetical protein